MKNRVLIFIDRVAPKNYLQIEAVNDIGFFPDFFVTAAANPPPEFDKQFSQKVLHKKFFRRTLQVFKHIANNKKIIHHVELYPGGRYSFLYVLIARLHRLTCICIERGDLLYYNKKGYGLVTRFSMWFCYRFSNAIWYKEPYMKPILQKLNKKLFFIHNAIRAKKNFTPVSPADKDITFLWMNRAIPQRRSDWFIDVLKKSELNFTKNYFIGLMPSSVYTIEENYLKKNKPGNLTVENYCNNPEDFYKRAKYFLLPSDVVFANHSLLESMSYGVVPLVSDQNGTSIIVENGVNGFVFNHTKKDFEQAVLQALQISEDNYMRLSIAATEKVSNDFSEEKYKSAIQKMYLLLNKP